MPNLGAIFRGAAVGFEVASEVLDEAAARNRAFYSLYVAPSGSCSGPEKQRLL